MLDRQKVIIAFEEKRDQFRKYHADQGRQGQLMRDLLARFTQMDRAALLDAIARRGIAWPGALPTVELDTAAGLRLPFAHHWRTHDEARAWALNVLQDRPVAAVDGSQITPTKDFSTPVGAVQIGWYVNYHAAGGRYVKNVEFEVLGPDELDAANDDPGSSDNGFPDWLVNQQRFVGECRRLGELMKEHAHLPEAQRPVCFLDGSLAISFAGHMREHRGNAYIQAVEELLEASEKRRIPLVAYVDTSFSRDLATLIQTVTNSTSAPALSDAGLLSPALTNWGDRSPLFLCARQDELTKNERVTFYNDIAFTYLNVVEGRTPARVEMPRWLLESGQAESVMDIVRAECIVGTGYPYAIETADAVAVITQQDRQRFYALWQQFMQRENIPLTQARKAGSKLGRR